MPFVTMFEIDRLILTCHNLHIKTNPFRTNRQTLTVDSYAAKTKTKNRGEGERQV